MLKSGRSSVERVTSKETLRSLEEVSMIVWDKTNTITARSVFKNGRKIYNAVYHNLFKSQICLTICDSRNLQRQNYVAQNILP